MSSFFLGKQSLLSEAALIVWFFRFFVRSLVESQRENKKTSLNLY